MRHAPVEAPRGQDHPQSRKSLKSGNQSLLRILSPLSFVTLAHT